MSIYESELRRRLASGEDVEQVASWYIDRMAESKGEWKDLTPFEARFFKRIHDAYMRWRRLKMN